MLFKRKIIQKIIKNLKKDKISILTGARQAGKTVILKQLQHYLEQQGKTVYFINLEDLEFVKLLNQTPKNLFKLIPSGSNKRLYVLIDEIQYLENPTNFLKYIYDEHKSSLKLIVSGSSAFYLDKKFKDSLAGRKKIFYINTLSFSEFLEFKNRNDLSKLLPQNFNLKNIRQIQIPKIYQKDLENLFAEFIVFGGYPAVVLADPAEKIEELEEIALSYIKKDILEAEIKQEVKFYDLLRILASQTGSLVNQNELASTLRLSYTAAANYLYIMRKSFHISLVPPFYSNLRKEITKMPKIFFRDTGLRNYFAKNFDSLELRSDKGSLWENLVFKMFLDRFAPDKIKFWHTQNKNEIDFIIDERFAFEAKHQAKDFKSTKYKLFQKQYPQMSLGFICYQNIEKYKSCWPAWVI